jgi:hypothetical protein
VVVGSRVRETGGRERVVGPKSETEPLWLGFGHAAVTGSLGDSDPLA